MIRRAALCVVACACITFLAVMPASSRPKDRPYRSDALVILRSKDFERTRSAIAELESQGIHVMHVFSPRTLICDLPADLEPKTRSLPAVALLHRTAVALPDRRSDFADTETGVKAWNSLINPAPLPPAEGEGSPLVGDALPVPAETSGSVTIQALPTSSQTSEYLIGSVTVGIILPESNGSGENWTIDRQDQVINQITSGCNWWATTGGTKAHLTFYYDIRRSVPTQYEPITMAGTGGQSYWMSECLTAIGYTATTGNYFTKTRDYVNGIRNQNHSNWAFAVYVVDSYNDSDGKFTDGYFGYAYLGGPLVVMTYDNDGWGIGRMNYVISHEIGHIFLAGDEYCSPGYACCDFAYYGYLNIYNANCEYNNPNSVNCIMRSGAHGPVCTHTQQQLGWRDSDADGLYDPIDTNVTCSAYTTSTGPTYYFTGAASDAPYDAPIRADCSINTIATVEYRVDGGEWHPANPADAFDSPSESFNFTVGPFASGKRTVETRATNTSGNYGPAVPKVFYIDSTPPNPPAVVLDDGDTTGSGTTLHASWSGASDPETGVASYLYAIGYSPVDTGSNYFQAWTAASADSVTLNGLLLSEGKTYYFYVKSKNYANQLSATSTASNGITVTSAKVDVAGAKRTTDGELVRVENKLVTAKMAAYLYIEDDDRKAGIRVDSPFSATPGDRLTVVGPLTTGNSERRISSPVITRDSTGNTLPPAIGLKNLDVGGGEFFPGIPGVTNARGPHNLGLLVRTWGRVRAKGIGYFYVDDGSGLTDGTLTNNQPNIGIRVLSTANVAVGNYVLVTGISAPYVYNSLPYRYIITRSTSDVVVASTN